jgi:chaperonin GroEL (HSP60 family)
MWRAGILDAAAVVKNAVRNAISLASTVLTGKIVITIPEKSAQQIAAEALQNKGLRF